ncbi:AraC family transcriptional regulator [Paenibacillus xylanilyticus]|uniref:Helix-turn-helix transcriptional regulator n=1 Tax=Paenibacillus xylanilyticus TaxID=248903 RepID=A0A7Y6C4C7_9BACL|nr:AraC family transcriptional regulator [Paenibacillus xylanilyticus]NUU79595.1 helix-turn-helix transcriptional regulator [Paenibacillus xylanilyticus]
MFDRVEFAGATLAWDYRIRSVNDFTGYYHWHQCGEFLYVHKGNGIVVLNNHTYTIRKGMLFFFQPYQLHHVYAEVEPENPYERNIFYIDPIIMDRYLESFPHRRAYFSTLWKGHNQQQVFDLSSYTSQLDWIYESYDRSRNRGWGEREESVMFLLQILSLLEQQNAGEGQQGLARQVKISRDLKHAERIMHWIEDHYEHEIKLDHMASDIHLSKSYASRIFQQETGSSITDYVTARRLKQAYLLLETTTFPIEEIGRRVGFPNGSYFIQLFRKSAGLTPLQYRHQFERKSRH